MFAVQYSAARCAAGAIVKMKKIGIIGAMESEVRSLVAQLTDVRETHSGNTVLYAGTLSGVAVVVVQSGVGKVNAALCAQRLILQHAVTHVVNTGIAGGVSANVGIMDVVISTDAVYHDVDAVYFGYQPTEIPQMACSDFPADSGLDYLNGRTFRVKPESIGFLGLFPGFETGKGMR